MMLYQALILLSVCILIMNVCFCITCNVYYARIMSFVMKAFFSLTMHSKPQQQYQTEKRQSEITN